MPCVALKMSFPAKPEEKSITLPASLALPILVIKLLLPRI